MEYVYIQIERLDEVEDADLFLLIDTMVLILQRQKSIEYVSLILTKNHTVPISRDPDGPVPFGHSESGHGRCVQFFFLSLI